MLELAQDLNIRSGTQSKTVVIADKEEYYFIFICLTKLSINRADKIGTLIFIENRNTYLINFSTAGMKKILRCLLFRGQSCTLDFWIPSLKSKY